MPAPTRTRPAPRGAATAAGSARPARASYRGAAGLAKMDDEQARQEADREARKALGFSPFRFWTPTGETRQIIIIDEAPDFFRYEHALKDRKTNRYDNFLPCINETANCPVCSVSEKPATFIMYLTVIDLTPYINKDDIEVPWSKKLLAVKPMQQKKIARLFEREGTLRGMILDMTRDSDKDASIGGDIEFVGWAEEPELYEYYDSYEDKDKKLVEIIGNEVFNYEEIMPDLTEKQLATIAGVQEDGVGSRRGDDRALGRGETRTRDRDAPVRSARRGDAADDQAPPARGQRPTREEAAPAPRRGATAGRRPAPEPEPDDQQYADDPQYDDTPQEQEAPAPRRGAAARRPAPEPEPAQTRRPAPRGSRAPAEEPPSRPAPRGSRAPAEDAPQRQPRGRADAQAAEPPFDDDVPVDGPAAPRRAALRNRRG